MSIEQPATPTIASAPGAIFDVSQIDPAAVLVDRDGLKLLIPHRDVMLLPDRIVWRAEDGRSCVGAKSIRDDEFWVPGHFPGKPLFPGVLMVETGEQVATYLFNSHLDRPTLAAFLRIEDCAFRNAVVPGDELFLLCDCIKASARRFISRIQGIVEDRIAFEATITGMVLPDDPQMNAP